MYMLLRLKTAFLLLSLVSLTQHLAAQPGTWLTGIGSPGLEIPGGMRSGSDGSTYFATTFSDTLTFKGNTYASAGQTDILVGKLSPAGDLVWANQYGWHYGEFAKDIVVNESLGVVWVGGEFHDSTVLGPDVINPYYIGPDFDFFVIKLDTAGNFIRTMNSMGASDERCQALTLDDSGNLWMTGRFENFYEVNWDTIFSTGLENIFVIRFDTSGLNHEQWQFGGYDNDQSFGIDVLGDTLVTVTGWFQDTVWFGDSTQYIASHGMKDGFVAAFSNIGDFRWAYSFGGTGYDFGNALQWGPNAVLYVAGQYDSTFDYRGQNLVSAGGTDGVLLRLDATGTASGLNSFGGAGYDFLRDVQYRAFNTTLLVTGSYQDQVLFGSDTLNSGDPANADMFLASLDLSGQPQWAVSGHDASYDEGRFVSCDNQGYISLMGVFGDVFSIGQASLTSAGSDDVFLMRLRPDGGVHREQNLSAFGLVLYPNPGQGNIHLRANGLTGESRIRIYDLQGREVLSKSWNPVQEGDFSAELNETGMYLLKVEHAMGTGAMRFVVQR